MKKRLIWALIIATAGAGLWIYLKTRPSKDFGPLVISRLEQLVSEGSEGLYRLRIDSIRIDPTNASIKLMGIRLRVDSVRLPILDSLHRAPGDLLSFSLDSLLVQGITPGDILDKKNIRLDRIELARPVILFIHRPGQLVKNPIRQGTLYSRIHQQLGYLYIHALSLRNIDFSFRSLGTKPAAMRWKDISFEFRDIQVDSSTQHDSTRLLYARYAFARMRDYSFRTADSLYLLHIKEAVLDPARLSLQLTGLHLQPRFSKMNFYRHFEYYRDRYDLDLDRLVLEHIDWYRLLDGESLQAGMATLDGGKIEVYADRRLPPTPDSKVGQYPHQLLLKMKMPVYIPKIIVKGINVRYEEFNPKSKETGLLSFDEVSGNLSNITNQKKIFARNPFLDMHLRAQFMQIAPMKVDFRFDLAHAASGAFEVTAWVGKLDAAHLSQMTEALGLLRINHVEVEELRAKIKGTNTRASGRLNLAYRDLHVTVLAPDPSHDTLRKKGLASLVANNFVLEKSNATTDPVSGQKNIVSERNIHKSFFNLIWKTMLDGILKTAKGKK